MLWDHCSQGGCPCTALHSAGGARENEVKKNASLCVTEHKGRERQEIDYGASSEYCMPFFVVVLFYFKRN